jgi:hypothetical protein
VFSPSKLPLSPHYSSFIQGCSPPGCLSDVVHRCAVQPQRSCRILQRLLTCATKVPRQLARPPPTPSYIFYVDEALLTEAWHTLVHVCRRWSQTTLASRCRSRRRILLTGRNPLMKALDVWPDLPIPIRECYHLTSNGMDSVIAALTTIAYVKSFSRMFPAPYWKDLP